MAPDAVWDGASGMFAAQTAKWNDLIETAGAIAGVENPRFASREDCWGDGGIGDFSERVTGRRINGGASVLNPFVCELLFRLYCPNLIKSPKAFDVFSGGVQMGFVSTFENEGMPQAEYEGLELRKNQCDVNNSICESFSLPAKWVRGDACDALDHFAKESKDFFFTCPPYYGIEVYRDYDGVNEKCANAKHSYKEYLNIISNGLRNACEILRKDRFGCVMIGDTRAKDGSYYGTTINIESILRKAGMKIWQRIIYIEPRGLRGITANKSSHATRKLANNYQTIIVFYKGTTKNIRAFFADLK